MLCRSPSLMNGQSHTPCMDWWNPGNVSVCNRSVLVSLDTEKILPLLVPKRSEELGLKCRIEHHTFTCKDAWSPLRNSTVLYLESWFCMMVLIMDWSVKMLIRGWLDAMAEFRPCLHLQHWWLFLFFCAFGGKLQIWVVKSIIWHTDTSTFCLLLITD